jgi:hypothetical protein
VVAGDVRILPADCANQSEETCRSNALPGSQGIHSNLDETFAMENAQSRRLCCSD